MTRSLLMILVLLATASAAHAQKATEIYIPIGRSPGLSGKVTVTGFIETVDDHTMVMSVKGADGGWRAVVTDRSKIYIDRSAQRRPNRYGTIDDCKPRRFCEIRFIGDDAAAFRGRGEPGEIEWIKIRPDNGRSQAEPQDHSVARRSRSSTSSQNPSEWRSRDDDPRGAEGVGLAQRVIQLPPRTLLHRHSCGPMTFSMGRWGRNTTEQWQRSAS